MIESGKSGTYAFISYEGSRLPGDPSVRNLIRRSAMKHAAAIRKRNGGYGKHNVGQLPPRLLRLSIHDEDANSSVTQPVSDLNGGRDESTLVAARTEALAAACCFWRTSLSPPPTNSFLLAMLSKPALLRLASPMNVLHLGISKLLYFQSDCVCFGQTISKMPVYLESRRLLSFISSRYGSVASITHATNCLVARLGYIVQKRGQWTPDTDVTALKYYSMAVRSLQEAIDDERLRMKPETLCSVQLLGIFELLNGTSQIDTWIKHVEGAARLIELRGPERFQTDFELSLVMTHAGPIITEALLNSKTCFLQEERWQNVIQTAVREDPLVFPDQEHLVTKLWACFSKCPNLFKRAQDIIMLRPMHALSDAHKDLINEMIKEQERLKEWLTLAEQHQYGTQDNRWQGLARGAAVLLQDYKNKTSSTKQAIAWRMLYGTYILCFLVQTRILYALSPSRFPDLEVTCQTLACEVMPPPSVVSSRSEDRRLVGGLFMSEVVWMAKAVVDTKKTWSQDLEDVCFEPNRRNTRMIASWKFKAWCEAIGRRVI